MADDPKSLYFGGGSSGLATILDSNQTARTQQRLDIQAQRKIAEQVKAKEDRDKQAEKLKHFDAWRYYGAGLQQEYQGIADDLKAGKIDNIELTMRLGEYATKAKSSLDLKQEYDDAAKDFQANKKVLNGAATEWYLNKYHADGSVENLKKISAEPLDRYGFVNEKGGSQYINPTEAFKDVVTNQLGGWVENTIKNDAAKGKVVARGLLQFAQSTDFTQTKSFAEVDEKTGKIKVKDIDQLIESGVTSLFDQDPFTSRILEDRTDQIIGNQEATPEERQRVKTYVLREILEPYGSTGTVKSEDTKLFRNFSVPSSNGDGSGGSDDDMDQAQRIYNVFSTRSVGQGADKGETKVYTQKMVDKYKLPDSFVGKEYIESTALDGYPDRSGRVLGRIIYRAGDKRFNNVARVEVFENAKAKAAGEDGKWQQLSFNDLQRVLPISVYKQVEKIAREEGRLTKEGNYIYRTNEEKKAVVDE